MKLRIVTSDSSSFADFISDGEKLQLGVLAADIHLRPGEHRATLTISPPALDIVVEAELVTTLDGKRYRLIPVDPAAEKAIAESPTDARRPETRS